MGQRSAHYTINVEEEDAYGVENGSHGFKIIPATSFEESFRHDALPDETVRNDVGEHEPIPGSKAGSEFGFTFNTAGGPVLSARTAAGNGVTAAQTPEGVIYKSGIGTEILGTGDTVNSSPSPTATVFKFNTQTPTQTTTIMFGVVISGVVEWRPGTISSGTVTLLYGLSAAPDTGAIVYACASYQLTNDISSARSFAAQILTDESTEKWLALGCYPSSIEISGTPGEVASVSVMAQCLSWTDAESDSLASPIKPVSNAWVGSHAIIIPRTDGSAYAAGHAHKLRDFTAAVARGLILRPDPNSAEGFCDFDTNGDPVFSMSTTHSSAEYVSGSSWRDAFLSGTAFHGIFSFGNAAGETLVLYVTDIHVREMPVNGDDGGIKTTSVVWGLTTGTTAPMVVLGLG